MKTAIDISKRLSALLVLVIFFTTTTGFTFYKHVCHHHGEEVAIAVIECCEEEVEELPANTSVCCETETTANNCDINDGVTSCCELDTYYYRLGDQFVDPQTEFKIIDVTQSELDCFGLVPDQKILDEKIDKKIDLPTQKPKQPFYRLYRQAKIDPLLI